MLGGPTGRLYLALMLLLAGRAAGVAHAQPNDAADLAKKLQNPVASLISVPIQNNFDFTRDTEYFQYKVNIQPVIPFSLTEDWNLISRTILPIIQQSNVVTDSRGDASQSGLGDTLQSLFFSPAAPGPGGLIWGLGPALLLPTGTNAILSSQKFSMGPTGVALTQSGGWTVGALANHLWSLGGDQDRDDVNSTFLQPFLSYTWPNAFSLTLNTESTYDWEHSQWTVPINVMASQLFKPGGLPMSLQVGARGYATRPDGGPDWGMRLAWIFLFPTK